MAGDDEDDDDIPILNEVLRPGEGRPARRADESAANERRHESPLTDAEIEAIASRVIERHTERMREAVTRAIRQAIDLRNRERQAGGDDTDNNRG